MTALHEMYLAVKQQVAEAVAAVNAATEAAAQIAVQAVQEALAAVEALDDYLDYFGWVGNPIDAACEAFLEQLYNLAKVLDDRGYYAIYHKTFGAANQYSSAKQAYDEFTGGHGGRAGGGGASGWFGTEPKNYPLFTCYNRNGAKLNEMGQCIAPTEDQVDYTVLLGACSDVFVYQDNDETCEWDNGIYQYARLRVKLNFVYQEVIFNYDYGESPRYGDLAYTLGYDYLIAENNHSDSFGLGNVAGEWLPVGPITYWPSDSHWESILNEQEEWVRDPVWEVLGRHERNGKDYWLYGLSYWYAVEVPAFFDGAGNGIEGGCPDVLKFIKVCEPSTPGKNPVPKPIPFPIPWPILTDDSLRANLAKALRLGLDLRPYEIMINRQKLTLDGEQLTIGDV